MKNFKVFGIFGLEDFKGERVFDVEIRTKDDLLGIRKFILKYDFSNFGGSSEVIVLEEKGFDSCQIPNLKFCGEPFMKYSDDAAPFCFVALVYVDPKETGDLSDLTIYGFLD